MNSMVLKGYFLTSGSMVTTSTSAAEITNVNVIKGFVQLSEQQFVQVSVGMEEESSAHGRQIPR